MLVAEEAENHEDVEKIWAVKALHHAETYFNLISKVDPNSITLTKCDDEIYKEFRKEWPQMPLEELNEFSDFKTPEAKEKWRNWIKPFETKVKDFNYGSLLRNRVGEGYGPENAFFVTRIQFLAIEIARNREKLNRFYQ